MLRIPAYPPILPRRQAGSAQGIASLRPGPIDRRPEAPAGAEKILARPLQPVWSILLQGPRHRLSPNDEPLNPTGMRMSFTRRLMLRAAGALLGAAVAGASLGAQAADATAQAAGDTIKVGILHSLSG